MKPRRHSDAAACPAAADARARVRSRPPVEAISGLPDIVDDELGLLVDGDDEASWAKVQTLPLEAAAGERFKYNHTNYVLLGKIIEKLAD